MRRLPAAVAGAQPLRWTAGQLPEAEGAGRLTKTGQNYETYQNMVEKGSESQGLTIRIAPGTTTDCQIGDFPEISWEIDFEKK